MSEPSDRNQRRQDRRTGDQKVGKAQQAVGTKFMSTHFRVFVPLFAGFTAMMALPNIFIGYDSFSPFKLLACLTGVVSLLVAACVFYSCRSRPDLPFSMYLLSSLVLQTCINTCRVAVSLAEGKPVDHFDSVTTPLLLTLTLIAGFALRNLRSAGRA
ncbi:hypothetical protein [Deinococcus altitudinis]|uniref:hypothetical protein n=1 Tax=Deinococcus altitudinis TaxID=468914 RepID=UPI0038927C94